MQPPDTSLRPALLAVIAAIAGPAPAQQAQPATVLVAAADYELARSHALYRSLDASGDDRLDLLEAAGLKTLAGIGDLQTFRRLDRNRNGYLDFAEFDAHYRDLVTHDQVLRLAPARPELLESPPPAPGPADSLLALFDQNGDAALARGEVQAMLAQFGLPNVAMAHFERLDRDGSGTLTVVEFGPLLSLFPVDRIPGLRLQRTETALPGGFSRLDRNADDRIDGKELQSYLRRLDPDLQVWAQRILRGADRNGDGVLSPGELAPRRQPQQSQE